MKHLTEWIHVAAVLALFVAVTAIVIVLSMSLF